MKKFTLAIAAIILVCTLKAQMVLNEVYSDPGAGNHEFFELYNTSSNQAGENLDNYTLITYYEESGKTGFYVLDLPAYIINPWGFFVSSSRMLFNVQGQTNISANHSWNLPAATGSLTKWESTGSGYVIKSIGPDLNDFFTKVNGSGSNYNIFIYKNGVLVNGLMGGSSSTIPAYIRAMPNLPVDMIAPSPDFTINFNSIADNQLEYVIPVPGSDNGYIRTRDGMCGMWNKSSAQVQHSPGLSNGTATGISGELTITTYLTYSNNPALPSYLNYNITAGDPENFPVTVEAYRDFGTVGQLDAADIIFDSRQINNTSAGLQVIPLVNPYDHVIVVVKAMSGCLDRIAPLINNRAALPVKLHSFHAFLQDEIARLEWITSSEQHVSHFVIERSTNGSDFAPAGNVFAKGNSTEELNYYFNDGLAGISVNVIYYRLRSVDLDGKSEYSETKVLRLKNIQSTTLSIKTFPNPVQANAHISIPAEWQFSNIVLEVIGMTGNTMIRKELAKASQTEILDMSNLPPGIYILKAQAKGGVAQQKIIKR